MKLHEVFDQLMKDSIEETEKIYKAKISKTALVPAARQILKQDSSNARLAFGQGKISRDELINRAGDMANFEINYGHKHGPDYWK